MPFVDVGGGPIDYQLVPASDAAAGRAPLVFLHEGLGSIELWRDLPAEVHAATGRRALVYSRHGHGRSATRAAAPTPRFMHDEALVVLPQLLDRLGVHRPVLIGHSDGASISLIHAGAGPRPVAGLVLLAPHVFVEDRSVEGIEAARRAYLTSDLSERMAKYHDDADAMFWGWNRIWLAPEFRDWNIEEYLPAIDRPVLVIQGEDDEYGTIAQIDAIERGVGSGRCSRVVLPDCGHAPHIDRPKETIKAVVGFVETCP
jgi:pimeloyl-ACP methyl ester carboxylesterase